MHSACMALSRNLPTISALHYIVGIGQITFNAAGTSGPTGCTVSHLELFYNDNALADPERTPAPGSLLFGSSLLGGGIAVLRRRQPSEHDGYADSVGFRQWRTATLAIDPSFGWTNGGRALRLCRWRSPCRRTPAGDRAWQQRTG